MSDQQKAVRTTQPIALMIENRKTGATVTAQVPSDGVLYVFFDPKDSDGKKSILTKSVTGTHVSHNNTSYVLGASGGSNSGGGGGFTVQAGTPVAIRNGDEVNISGWSIIANFKG